MTKKNTKTTRGWFPQEPITSKVQITNSDNAQNLQTTDGRKYRKEISLTQNVALLFVVLGWTLWLLKSSGHLPHPNFAAYVIAGLAIGTFLGIAPAHMELKKLSVMRSSSVRLSELSTVSLFFVGAGLILGSMAVQGSAYFSGVQYSLITFFYSGLISDVVLKALFFSAWERKYKADIMRGRGYVIFFTQKIPPTTPRYFFGRKMKDWS